MADNKFGTEFFKKLNDEATTLHSKWVEQSFKAMDEYHTLARANLKYWVDLQTDARRIASEFVS